MSLSGTNNNQPPTTSVPVVDVPAAAGSSTVGGISNAAGTPRRAVRLHPAGGRSTATFPSIDVTSRASSPPVQLAVSIDMSSEPDIVVQTPRTAATTPVTPANNNSQPRRFGAPSDAYAPLSPSSRASSLRELTSTPTSPTSPTSPVSPISRASGGVHDPLAGLIHGLRATSTSNRAAQMALLASRRAREEEFAASETRKFESKKTPAGSSATTPASPSKTPMAPLSPSFRRPASIVTLEASPTVKIDLPPTALITTTKSTPDAVDDPLASAPADSSVPLSQQGYKRGPKSPIESANILSILSVWWASSLIVLGNSRPLENEDIPEMPSTDTTAHVLDRFQKYWRRAREKGGKPSLPGTLFRAFGGWFISGGVMIVISTVFQLLQPIFVRRLVKVLDTDGSDFDGYMWAMALIVATALASLFLNQHFFLLIRAGNAARVACAAAIYDKALTLSRASRQAHSTGATLTMMANDTQRLFDFAMLVHYVWLSPATIVVALVLMITEVGVAAVAGVALFCLVSPLQVYISRLTGRNRRALMQCADQRVKLTSEVLAGIKVVKLYGPNDDCR